MDWQNRIIINHYEPLRQDFHAKSSRILNEIQLMQCLHFLKHICNDLESKNISILQLYWINCLGVPLRIMPREKIGTLYSTVVDLHHVIGIEIRVPVVWFRITHRTMLVSCLSFTKGYYYKLIDCQSNVIMLANFFISCVNPVNVHLPF